MSHCRIALFTLFCEVLCVVLSMPNGYELLTTFSRYILWVNKCFSTKWILNEPAKLDNREPQATYFSIEHWSQHKSVGKRIVKRISRSCSFMFNRVHPLQQHWPEIHLTILLLWIGGSKTHVVPLCWAISLAREGREREIMPKQQCSFLTQSGISCRQRQ